MLAATIRVPSNKPDLDAALEGLVNLNVALMRSAEAKGRPIPPLYKAGVHWQPDGAKGKPAETWDTLAIVMRRGYGDCEDLAAWRAAELRFCRGIRARAVVRKSRTPGVAWHCIVQLPDGTLEDPSIKLGMYEKQRELAGLPPLPKSGQVGANLAKSLLALHRRVTAWTARRQAAPKPRGAIR